MQKRINLSGGFTLIEILLVVILLGMMAAMSLPNFSRSFQRLQLQDSTQDLAYLMRYAQNRAIVKAMPVKLIFDEAYKTYWLTQQSPPEENETEEKFADIEGRWGRVFHIPEEITVTGAIPAIEFYPDGRVDKIYMQICRQEECMAVSTETKRGSIQVLEEAAEAANEVNP